jgi:adenosylhomocysteine nucleosidase
MPYPERITHVVIITALAKELDAVLKHIPNAERKNSNGRVTYKGTVEGYNVVALSLSGMGNVNAAVATTQAIDVWNPQCVIVTGITGGIAKGSERLLGDIIVAEQIVGYEQGRVSDESTSRRYDVLRPDHGLFSVAKEVDRQPWYDSILEKRPDGTSGRVIPTVHFGVVASGEKIVAGGDLPHVLQDNWPRLVGIEMEAYGTALATYQAATTPGLLFVKGICDWVNSAKNDAWQHYAADAAAAFVVEFLRLRPFEPVKRPQATRRHPPRYRGTSKIDLCRNLGKNWHDLADYFEIPLNERDQFDRGRECQEIWEWLERRRKLEGLPEGLVYINREDLVELLVVSDESGGHSNPR